MRILHILDHSVPHRSGYALSTYAMLQAQRERGWHTIHLTGPAQGPMPEQETHERGWHFFRTRVPRAALAPLPFLRRVAALHALTARLRHVIRLTRPDLLHAHAPAVNGLAALHVARRCGLPVVYEDHAWWTDTQQLPASVEARASTALEALVVRHADGLCAPTRAALACLRARIHRMPGAVIPAAYEASLDSPVPPWRGDTAATRGPALVCAGSLAPEQGIELLLNALPRVTMFHPGLTLHLAATGRVPPGLHDLVRARRLDAHVSLAENVPVPELAVHMARADLAVFPRLRSRHADLYSPFIVLEALAHGVAVAASNVGGHRDLIEHGRTGILFEAGSSTALGDTLLALLSERGCLTPLGNAARSWVTMHRHWPASAACYAPVYTRLVGRRRI